MECGTNRASRGEAESMIACSNLQRAIKKMIKEMSKRSAQVEIRGQGEKRRRQEIRERIATDGQREGEYDRV